MNRNTVLATTLSCLAAVISAEVKPRAFSTQPQYFGQGAARCPLSSLKAQGFSGPTGRGVTIKFLGNIPAPKGEYFAYGHYFINPDNNHGHQRILIMLRYCKYIGHYFAMAEPIRIRGNAIIFDAPKAHGNVIRFSNRLPPKQAWIDGEVHDFTR